MKILLVKPYNLSDHIQPSLGLGYLATSVRDRHEVNILDCIKEKIKPEDFEKYIADKKPDIVGFQCYTYDLPYIKTMLRACKNNNIMTILGGPHPSVMPRETMELFGDDLDYCFQGEAETGFPMLLEGLAGGLSFDKAKVPGLVFREGGSIVVNKKVFVEDLDKLGIPAWDLIKPQKYPEAQHGAFFMNFPIAPIIITRGCPYSCTFCSGNLIAGKRIRKRSVGHVLNEIDKLYNSYGIREFHVIDDNFTMDKEFAKRLLKSLKEKNLKISWAVPNGVRMETLDDEMLSLMKETGLYLISLGIESGSDRVLRLMKKGTNTALIKNAVEKIRKANIDIAGFFIIGFPGETKEDIEKTIDFALKLDLIRANFFTYLPFPGTESYEQIKTEEGLDKVNWDKFYFMSAPYAPRGIDSDTLKALQRKAFIKFYMRPKIFWKNVSQIKSPRHFKFLFTRFCRWILMK